MDKLIPKCEVCDHPDIANVEKLFFDKEITKDQAAKYLKVSTSTFVSHITHHTKQQIKLYTSGSAIELSNMFVNKIEEMIHSFERNKTQIEKLIKYMEDEEDPNKDLLNVYFKLESLLGNQIERMAKITGELKEINIVKVKQLNLQLTKLQEIIINNTTDPDVRDKVLKVLDATTIDEERNQVNV